SRPGPHAAFLKFIAPSAAPAAERWRSAARRHDMRWLLTGLLLLAPVVPSAADDATTVVFTGVTLVDMEAGKLVPNRAVVVTGPKVTAVVAAEGFRPPDGATVVPAAGKYLIPGLWDMHVHHEFP